MPIEFTIDHARRLVTATARGMLTGQDVFGYQRAAWSRTDVQGYNELLDMREVEGIDLPSIDNMRALAELSASMDIPQTSSKFAIVATSDEAFGHEPDVRDVPAPRRQKHQTGRGVPHSQ